MAFADADVARVAAELVGHRGQVPVGQRRHVGVGPAAAAPPGPGRFAAVSAVDHDAGAAVQRVRHRGVVLILAHDRIGIVVVVRLGHVVHAPDAGRV